MASILGSLEVLTELLKGMGISIPFSVFGIGMASEWDAKEAGKLLDKKKEYVDILAFDVYISLGVCKYADKTGVRIFRADVIYHLPQ